MRGQVQCLVEWVGELIVVEDKFIHPSIVDKRTFGTEYRSPLQNVVDYFVLLEMRNG